MNIIRLTKGQKRQMKFEHPLLDGSSPMTEERLAEDWGNKDDIILGHLYFIKIIVGRFLANWPETRRFTDDMVSEGMLAVTEYVSEAMKNDRPPVNFQAICWTKIRTAIEIMLNNSRSMFSPSIRAQWNLLKDGQSPIYNYANRINEDLGPEDVPYDPDFVDILDELEHLTSTDREALRLIIYRCMEQDHNILESNITQEEIDAINSITKAITEM